MELLRKSWLRVFKSPRTSASTATVEPWGAPNRRFQYESLRRKGPKAPSNRLLPPMSFVSKFGALFLAPSYILEGSPLSATTNKFTPRPFPLAYPHIRDMLPGIVTLKPKLVLTLETDNCQLHHLAAVTASHIGYCTVHHKAAQRNCVQYLTITLSALHEPQKLIEKMGSERSAEAVR